MQLDPLSILLFGIAALLIVFQLNSSKKRKREMEAMQANMIVGARILTFSGIVGDIVKIDGDIVSVMTGTSLIEIKKGAIREATPGAPKSETKKSVAKKPATSKPAAKKSAAK